MEPAEGLAERLGGAVAAVGPRHHGAVDGFLAPIIADDVQRTGEDEALDAVLPRRLEGVVGAQDVARVDHLPGAFLGLAAHVDDGVDALHGGVDLVGVLEVGKDNLLAGTRRVHLEAVGKTQQGIAPGKALAQHAADAAGGAGKQNTLHGGISLRFDLARV